MVKAYARSAAGMDVELVSEMRSPSTCLKTVDYLFDRLDHDDFEYLQNWIWDRTRAVRKDLRTQRIESKTDINILLTCLERTARFHLLSMHHMARSTKHDYTHQQDLEQLNQTMMSLRERYTDNRRAGIPSENEAEFWAYRLILAPQYATHQLEDELHRLPSHIRYNMRVQTAVEIYQLLKSVLITRARSFVQCQANWKKLWELIKSPKVSYLMACAAEVSFNRVRHVVLDCLWRAFRVGNAKRLVVVEDWTTDKLKDVLGLDSDQEAVKLCEDFGFEFGLNHAGQTFLDITKKGYGNQVLAKPTEDNPQTFSANLVESKRHDRALSAIIHGMSVQQARETGWLVEVDTDLPFEEEMADEHSLFVPETSSVNSNHLTQSNLQPQGMNSTSSIMEANKPFNPFAKPFQPSSTTAAAPNPFLKAAPTLQQGSSTQGLLQSGIQPGLFNPSTDRIQFGDSNGVSSSPVSTSTSATSTSVNPFLKGASVPSTASLAQPNPFKGTNTLSAASIPQPNPFQGSSAPSAATPAQPNPFKGTNGPSTISTPQPNPFTRNATPSPQLDLAPAALKAGTSFTFPGQAQDEKNSQPTASSVFSFTPTGSPAPVSAAPGDEANQDAENARQEAARKVQLEAEARRRVQEAQQARALKEAEQRQKQAVAEAERQQQEQLRRERERRAKEEQERRAKEERERLAQEARRRQVLEEEARVARMRSMELAWQSLTMDVIFNKEEGLMVQFIENTVLNMSQEVMEEERRRKEEADLREQRRCFLARAVIARWIDVIQKRKRAEQTRNRRKRIKEQRARAAEMNEKVTNEKSVSFDAAITEKQTNSNMNVSQHTTTTSARRARRTQERRGDQSVQVNGHSKMMPPQQHPVQPITTPKTKSKRSSNNVAKTTEYSKAYHQSSAPIDRTETDWFKLRALGIDPSKQRKRSFDSTSDAEELPLTEQKRAKLSPVVKDECEATPQPSTTAEDHMARFRAIQQAFKKSEASPPRLSQSVASFNGNGSLDMPATKGKSPITTSRTGLHQSINGVNPTNGGSSNSWNSSQLIIAKAREIVADSTAQLSPSNVQHDWGRSVPNLGYTPSRSEASFGRSTHVSIGKERPAYWGRASRFVPRHLYGKGPEAIKAYNDQYVKRSPSNSTRPVSMEPHMQFSESSMLQQSYAHQPGSMHEQYSEEDDIAIVDGEAIDEDGTSSEDEAIHAPLRHNQQYAQLHSYENEDSEMSGTEEDSDPITADGYGIAQHHHTSTGYPAPGYGQAYLHGEEGEEVYEDYDEYSGEEEDDSSPHSHHAPYDAQRFAQQHGNSDHHSIKQSSTPQGSFNQGGNTEDDAIELSD